MPTYLCCFLHRHVDFRIAELQSIADLEQTTVSIEPCPLSEGGRRYSPDDKNPFFWVTFPSEEAAIRVVSRTLLVKVLIEPWGVGKTYDDILAQANKIPREQLERCGCLEADYTFAFQVEGYGRTYSYQEQCEIIDKFEGLPFIGTVNMKKARNIFWVIEDVGLNCHEQDVPPRAVYFGRQVARGPRELIGKYDLKKRRFLGPTSMDAELSLIIANMCHARPGMLIFDPYAGTGGILVACAHHGAQVLGADIDIRMLLGKSEGCNQLTNFKQYGLPPPVDLVRCDNNRCVWRPGFVVDAIVCDPPYGIRAGVRRAGSSRNPGPIEDHQREEHIPGTQRFTLPDAMDDLLRLAVTSLPIGGRLVYWLPTTPEYLPEDVPQHPCLRLVANSEQILTSKWRRRLITMVKTQHWDPALHTAVVTRDPTHEPSYANFSMKIMKDPNRLEKSTSSTGASATTASALPSS